MDAEARKLREVVQAYGEPMPVYLANMHMGYNLMCATKVLQAAGCRRVYRQWQYYLVL